MYGHPGQQRQVSKSGLSAIGTGVHLLLTFMTCGCWGIVWFLHWLFTRSKTVTTTTYQSTPQYQQPPPQYPRQ